MNKTKLYNDIVENYKQVKSNWSTLLELCEENGTQERYAETVGTYSRWDLDHLTKYKTNKHSRTKGDLEFYRSVTIAMLELSEQEINNQLDIMDYIKEVDKIK
jgi:hypothetical protein